MERLASIALGNEGPEPVDSGARVEEPLDEAGRRSFDAILGGAVVILGILSVVMLLPGGRLVVDNGNLDVVLNTLTAVAAAGAAALAWIRYRIEREVAAIHESAAFLVLCATRLLIIGITAFGSPDQMGMSLNQPQQWPLYAWSIARFASAVLLVAAARSALRRSRATSLPPWLLGVGPVAGLLGLFLLLQAVDAELPALMGTSGFDALRGDPSAVPGMEPLGLALQVAIAGTYIVGAVLYRRLFRERGRRYAGYLVLALVVAGFSQIHWAVFPGIYRPVVTVDDLLRALFSVILLLGIEAQFRGDVRALRTANARLEALRRREADRAAIEASTRLAREVHDGLSQDLWLAKLAHARLAALKPLPGEAHRPVRELGEAIDRALGDARAVVASLRSNPGAVGLGDAVRRAVGEFEARTGVRSEVSGLGCLAGVEEPQAGEILRIVQEALTNAGKHADATTVRVTASQGPASIEVTVLDNGRGFEAVAAGRSSFGLTGMRERAAAIGGSLEIESRPADGTRIVLSIPRPAAPWPAGGQ